MSAFQNPDKCPPLTNISGNSISWALDSYRDVFPLIDELLKIIDQYGDPRKIQDPTVGSQAN